MREGACLIWEQNGRREGQTVAYGLRAEVELSRQAVVGVIKKVTPRTPPAAPTRRPQAAPPPP